MALEGYFGFARAPARPADNDNNGIKDAYLAADWGERVVITVAVSSAIVVVALIAVLMGSVGP
jgi:hypothetical protein